MGSRNSDGVSESIPPPPGRFYPGLPGGVIRAFMKKQRNGDKAQRKLQFLLGRLS
jgi:hypothetical protein